MMIIAQSLTSVAAIVLMLHACMKLNKMTLSTHHGVRVAYTLIAIASFGEFAAVVFANYRPSLSEVLMFTGYAILQSSCRRGGQRRTHFMSTAKHS